MALEFSKWIDETCNYKLMIKDVMNMKKGDIMAVLVLDRNIGDVSMDANPENVIIDPYEFFRYNFATYIHDSGLKGIMIYHWKNEDYRDDDFEFDIEYETGNWYPLENGYLPKRDPQGFSEFNYPRDISWTEFPINTGIGWRGPMILHKYINYLPNIYVSEDN